MAQLVSPLTIQMAIAFHVSDHPEQFFNSVTWGSNPAKEARGWLLANGLLTRDPHNSLVCLPTPKLAAWVDFICATPLPVQEWRLPPVEETYPLHLLRDLPRVGIPR